MKKEVVLDRAEIAATKELVTLRTDAKRSRLFVANGSDESATILSLPDLAVVREITMEGEKLRDMLPDPAGRNVYLLGRRVHVFDGAGERKLRTLPVDEPMAIALSASGKLLAVLAPQDFGNGTVTMVVLFDTSNFSEVAREPLQTEESIEAALFAADDRALVAFSRKYRFEKSLSSRAAKAPAKSQGSGPMRMTVEFGDLVNSYRICLPERSGAQIAAIANAPDRVVYPAQRCSTSSSFAGSENLVTASSIYGVDAYAIAFDPLSSTVAATTRTGTLTIYRLPE